MSLMASHSSATYAGSVGIGAGAVGAVLEPEPDLPEQLGPLGPEVGVHPEPHVGAPVAPVAAPVGVGGQLVRHVEPEHPPVGVAPVHPGLRARLAVHAGDREQRRAAEEQLLCGPQPGVALGRELAEGLAHDEPPDDLGEHLDRPGALDQVGVHQVVPDEADTAGCIGFQRVPPGLGVGRSDAGRLQERRRDLRGQVQRADDLVVAQERRRRRGRPDRQLRHQPRAGPGLLEPPAQLDRVQQQDLLAGPAAVGEELGKGEEHGRALQAELRR